VEACVSGPTIALLGVVATAVQGTIVTLFWLLVRAKDAQVAKAELREAEWRRLAIRGADEIIPPLVSDARERVREQLRELREPR
jgi:Flp pilus assembly protein protease CpaA